MERKIGKAMLMVTLLLISVLMSAVKIQPAKGSGFTEAYYPSEFSLYFGTQHVGGSLTNLQMDDGVSMQFGSVPIGPTVRPLYAHQEWIYIAGTGYRLLKLESSDASGTILAAPASAPARIQLGRFVYSLSGIGSVMPSYWSFVYYARADAGVGAYINVDIKILTSGGGIRQVITMYAASSPYLSTSWTALPGGFSFPGYGVVDQTDYLLVEYYANIVQPYSGGVYLLIDASSLPPNYQTSINNVALPQDQIIAVEFIGTSDTYLWSKLNWTIDSAWSAPSVQVTFQLFNFTAGAYPSSGNGYIEYWSSGTPLTYETKSQEITTNPSDFRSTSGLWKVMVKGVKYATSFPFFWYADFMQYRVRYLGFIVPDDFPTIQEAINAASPGYSIYVRSGVYYENLLVNKNIRLEGENAATTVIDGNGAYETIKVQSNDVVVSNFTIRNGNERGCGIMLDHVKDCKVIGNNITANKSKGIWLYHSSNNTIIRNNITNNGYGISLVCSNGNTISANFITNNIVGILLSFSNNNTIMRNNITDNGQGIYSKYLDSSNGNTISANLITNSRRNGIGIEGSNNTISGNTVANTNEYGIVICCGDNNVVVGNVILNSASGISVRCVNLRAHANNNTIAGNTVTNSYYGIRIFLYEATGNLWFNNTVSNNIVGFAAVFLEKCRKNMLSDNVIVGNDVGIQLGGYNAIVSDNIIKNNNYGMKLEGAVDNSILRNTLTENNESIYLVSSPSNIIIANEIKGNILGIHLFDSSDNSFFSNNFTDNVNQVYVETDSNNTWDNGYPWGGNFWSDYTGVDQYSGPYQNETGSDGIGDTPYTINMDNQDLYPLMNPYVGPLPPTYTLTITATPGGTTIPPPDTYTYFHGHNVHVQATPYSGWYLDHWELDGVNVGSVNPIIVKMDGNHTLLAIFKYAVTIKAFDVTEGLDVNVDIWMDGYPTGYKTPHTFTGLTGTHTFSVPEIDPYNHPTKRGNSSTVTSGATIIFYYGEETMIRFEPLETSVWMNQTFTVKVVIENVLELYGFEIRIQWNTTYLQYVSHTVTVPVENYPGGTLHAPVIWLKNEVDATAGTYWLAVSSMAPAPPFNGNGTAFLITFKSLNQSGITTIDFLNIDLADKDGRIIPHSSINCSVEVLPGYVFYDVAITNITSPKTVIGQGYTTNVNVTIANQGNFTETFNVTLYAQPQEFMNETGLIGYWKFDEGTGTTAYDSSGNNNDGTIYGATWTSGKIGNALQFDGIDDYVLCGSNSLPTGNAPRTVSLWFKAFDIPSDRNTILAAYGQPYAYDVFYLVIIGETKKVYVGMWGGGDTPSTSTSIQAGIWYHVTVTYDGTTARIYLNGIEEGSSLRSFATTLTDFYITDYWPGHYFNGIIDEVKVYNRSLSAEEVWAEYTGQAGFIIGTQTVTLESGASTTLTFTWNTTGFAKGNYTIWAYASPVPGEIDTSDNTFVDGWVVVAMVGDINADGIVDIFDCVRIALAFSATSHDPNWDPNADIDNSNLIDIFDLVIVAIHFGETDP
jgi:parallel beta-helix repeat protein